MIDIHSKIQPDSSLLPGVPGALAYAFFVSLGLAAGLLYLLWAQRQAEQRVSGSQPVPNRPDQPAPGVLIAAAALIGGTIGTKIPILLSRPSLAELLVSKSVVGGLIGGMIAVLAVKRVMHIQMRMGNTIAPAAALGLAIGRIGCFFNGCCFGIPASWGFNFGDGQLRLPTQLFEAAFQIAAFAILHRMRMRVRTPGILFKVYVASYFLFRFLIEFIRIHPAYWLGLTVYQLICLAGIAWMVLMLARQKRARQSTVLEATHEQ